MLKIKVCGITQPRNLLKVAALNPDYLGFIFYPPSPRDVTTKIADLPLSMIPREILKVAVTVNLPVQETLKLVDNYGFDMVQLHGNESPEYCMEIRQITKVAKVFPVWDLMPSNIDNYAKSCDYILFDTRTEKHGGSGLAFSHQILDDYVGEIPFFLGGGITAEFSPMSPVLSHPAFHALDINSRFETEPGIKNTELLHDFFIKMRGS